MNDDPRPAPSPASGETAQRVVKNSLWLFAAEALAKLLALLTQVVAARYLGKEGFGVFSFAFSLTGALTVFVDTGLSLYLTREVSREPDRARDYLRSVMGLKLGLSLATAVLLVAGLGVSELSRETVCVALLIGVSLMVHGFTDLYLAVFRAFEQMALVSVLTVLARVLFFALGLAVLLMGADVLLFSAAFCFTSVLCFFIARWQMRVSYQFKFAEFSWQLVRKIVRQAAPVCGALLFTYIYFRIDAVLVFFLAGKAETGRYAAAFKLIEALFLLMASVRLALFPVFSKSFKNDRDAGVRLWRESARYLLLITLPLAVGMAVCASPIVELLYGERYAGAGIVLAGMALGFPLLCLNDLAAHLLLSGHRTRRVLLTAGAFAVLNPIANLYCIPRWGVTGAAFVAAGTQWVLFAVYLPQVRSALGAAPFFTLAWRPAVAAAGMAGLLFGLEGLPFGVLVVLAGAVYFLLLIFLKTFNASDRGVLTRILKAAA